MLPVSDAVISKELQTAIQRTLDFTAKYQEVSERTSQEYNARARKYLSWCLRSHNVAIPATAETVELYLKFLSTQSRSLSTLKALTQIVAWLHHAAGLEGYRLPGVVAKILRAKAKNGYAKHPKQSRPLTAEMLSDLAEKVNPLNRAEAVALLGCMVQYDTATRISEMLSLRVKDLRQRDNGSALVRLLKAKNDQTRRGSERNLSRTTMGYYIRFLKNYAVDSEFIICTPKNTQYTRPAFSLRIKTLLRSHGLHGVSSHGARIGWCVDSFDNGIDPLRAVKYVDWKNTTQYLNYLRNNTSASVGDELATALGR